MNIGKMIHDGFLGAVKYLSEDKEVESVVKESTTAVELGKKLLPIVLIPSVLWIITRLKTGK